MRVTQVFRFELDPSARARVALAKSMGAAQFCLQLGVAALPWGPRARRAPSHLGSASQGVELLQA